MGILCEEGERISGGKGGSHYLGPEERSGRQPGLFAMTKPAAIQWGVAIEQQINCADNDRLLMHLMGITGNIDARGGQVLSSSRGSETSAILAPTGCFPTSSGTSASGETASVGRELRHHQSEMRVGRHPRGKTLPRQNALPHKLETPL